MGRILQAGDIVFVRAVVLAGGTEYVHIRVEDFPTFAFSHWAPACEVARLEDIRKLKPVRHRPFEGPEY